MLLKYLSEKNSWANELIIFCTAAVIGCDIWITSPKNSQTFPFSKFTPSFSEDYSDETNYYNSIWLCMRNNFHFQSISPVKECDVMRGDTQIGYKKTLRTSKKIRHKKTNLDSSLMDFEEKPPQLIRYNTNVDPILNIETDTEKDMWRSLPLQ